MLFFHRYYGTASAAQANRCKYYIVMHALTDLLTLHSVSCQATAVQSYSKLMLPAVDCCKSLLCVCVPLTAPCPDCAFFFLFVRKISSTSVYKSAAAATLPNSEDSMYSRDSCMKVHQCLSSSKAQHKHCTLHVA
jgi:hypothetical protein